MKKRISDGIGFILFLLPVLLFISCQSDPPENRQSDWANVTLSASGFGPLEEGGSISERIKAIQHAKVDAYTQLESQIMALMTDSKKTISDLSDKDETLKPKIVAFVRGAKIVRTEIGDTGVNIVAELFLGESFKATIGLAKKKQKPLSNQQRNNNLPRELLPTQ